MLSPQLALVAGEAPQQEAPTPVYPRMVVSPGERRSPLGGMTLMPRPHPRAGENNPNHPIAGEAAEGAITQGTGENQKRTKRVPQTLDGREKLEVGRKTHETGECLHQDLEYLEVEEMEAGESQFVSVPVGRLKAGVANLRMGLVVVVVVAVEAGEWALGVPQAQ